MMRSTDSAHLSVPPLRTKENGFEREGALHPDVHPSKRPCTISPAQRFSPSNGLSYQPNGLPHPGPLPPQHYRLDDMAIAHHYRDTYRHPASNHREIRERARPIGEDTVNARVGFFCLSKKNMKILFKEVNIRVVSFCMQAGQLHTCKHRQVKVLLDLCSVV